VVDAGAQLQVSWTVVNEGSAPAAATWQDALWLNSSQAPGGSFFGDTARTTNLAPGVGYTVDRTITVPNLPPGTYYLIVAVDRLGNVAEAQEGDNQLVSLPITIRTPNLRPTAITVNPTVVDAGGQLDVGWTVANEGSTLARASWVDALWLNSSQTPGGSFFGDTERAADVAAGASYTVNRTITVPNLAPGTYYLIVGVDRLGNVYEGGTDGDNGIVSIPITIRTPDLRVTAVSATKGAGGGLSIEWTVTNEGTAVAKATWQDGVWVNTGQTAGGTFHDDTARTTDLAPGASYTVTKAVTLSGLAAGTYYAVVRTDRLGAVYEGGEESDNEAASASFTVP
jgi:hypothetical protein